MRMLRRRSDRMVPKIGQGIKTLLERDWYKVIMLEDVSSHLDYLRILTWFLKLASAWILYDSVSPLAFHVLVDP
jgi:hypothetical protein